MKRSPKIRTRCCNFLDASWATSWKRPRRSCPGWRFPSTPSSSSVPSPTAARSGTSLWELRQSGLIANTLKFPGLWTSGERKQHSFDKVHSPLSSARASSTRSSHAVSHTSAVVALHGRLAILVKLINARGDSPKANYNLRLSESLALDFWIRKKNV